MSPTKDDILQGIMDNHGIPPERLTVISRRLSKELQGLESAGIEYQISYHPIYRSSFGNRNLVEIKMIHRDHNLFIVIGDHYPFQAPIFLIDQVCNATKDCRIRDGMRSLPIFVVTEMIREFAIGVDTYQSLEGDLISPKQIAEVWIGHRRDRATNNIADRLHSMIPEYPPESKVEVVAEGEGGAEGEVEVGAEGEVRAEVEVGADESLLSEEDAQNFASEQEKLLNYMMRFTKFHSPTTTMVQAHAMMIECFEYY